MTKIDELMRLADEYADESALVGLACGKERLDVARQFNEERRDNKREALRTALEAALVQGEPVAWCPECRGTGLRDSGGVHPWGEHIDVPCDCSNAPQAEPVAWRHKELVNGEFVTDWILTKYEPAGGIRIVAIEPLYTTPQSAAWVGLTDEEVQAIRAKYVNTPAVLKDVQYGWAINFARAIESAVRKQFGVSDD